jgi:hypothetical protein
MADCDREFRYWLGVELFIIGVRAIAERQRSFVTSGTGSATR